MQSGRGQGLRCPSPAPRPSQRGPCAPLNFFLPHHHHLKLHPIETFPHLNTSQSYHQETATMPLFVLSPASLAHSALFAGYYSYLSANVISLRLKTGVLVGDGGAGSVRDPSAKPNPTAVQDEAALKRSVRAHGNFAEGTPFAFFLIFLAELNGAPTSLVHGAYTSLFVARILHGELGIRAANTLGFGRPIGALATLAVTLSAGLYNLNLGFEPLKSFLGLK